MFVPSRAQAQTLDSKEETLNHDKYEYDEEKDEIIENGYRFKNRRFYTRKDGRKIKTFYCHELKKKKDVPYYFQERLRMKDKMKSDEAKKNIFSTKNYCRTKLRKHKTKPRIQRISFTQPRKSQN